jgi:hypothetical protein
MFFIFNKPVSGIWSRRSRYIGSYLYPQISNFKREGCRQVNVLLLLREWREFIPV